MILELKTTGVIYVSDKDMTTLIVPQEGKGPASLVMTTDVQMRLDRMAMGGITTMHAPGYHLIISTFANPLLTRRP